MDKAKTEGPIKHIRLPLKFVEAAQSFAGSSLSPSAAVRNVIWFFIIRFEKGLTFQYTTPDTRKRDSEELDRIVRGATGINPKSSTSEDEVK